MLTDIAAKIDKGVSMQKQKVKSEVSLNDEQGLYVIKISTGYSCHGYDVVYRLATGIAKWLGKDIVIEGPGTLAAYEQYTQLCAEGFEYNRKTLKRCEIELVPELKGLEGKRVEVVDNYGETRRFIVGRSTGWMPCHLEISRRNSSGGPAVMGSPFKSVRVVS